MIHPVKRRPLWAIGSLLAALLCLSLLLSGCMVIPGKSITGAAINENGELVLSYANGSEENLGNVVGTSGKDGTDGLDGTDGRDGLNAASSSEEQLVNATAKGLRSSVSVTCRFTAKRGNSSYGSAGSGIIYRLNKNAGTAYILTNYHVVYDADSSASDGISPKITVYLYGSEYSGLGYTATYVGGSMTYDIAVLRIEDEALSEADAAMAVTVGNSGSVTVGEQAIAIGNPEGEGIAASAGVVSVDSEKITMTGADNQTSVTMRLMRIDTAVNSGNSGGGLFNNRGEWIGIVNAKIIDESVENIAYAIPSNIAAGVADNIIDHNSGSVRLATLGIETVLSDSRAVYDAQTGKVSILETITVNNVTEGGLADGKLEKDDVFVSASLHGETLDLTRQHDLPDLLLTARVGDTLTLTMLRGAQTITETFTISQDCLKTVA